MLLSDNGTVALSPSKTRLCVHVMGQPLYRTTGKEKERQRDTHWLETAGGQDGDGDEISVMPVRAHFSSRLTRWPVLLSPAPHVCVPPCTSTGWVEIVRPSHHHLPVCHSLPPSCQFISHAFPDVYHHTIHALPPPSRCSNPKAIIDARATIAG